MGLSFGLYGAVLLGRPTQSCSCYCICPSRIYPLRIYPPYCYPTYCVLCLVNCPLPSTQSCLPYHLFVCPLSYALLLSMPPPFFASPLVCVFTFHFWTISTCWPMYSSHRLPLHLFLYFSTPPLFVLDVERLVVSITMLLLLACYTLCRCLVIPVLWQYINKISVLQCYYHLCNKPPIDNIYSQIASITVLVL